MWDEARKALYATDLTQQQELFTARISRFERTLDAQSGRVDQLQAKESEPVITRSPFVSVPAAQSVGRTDTLGRVGIRDDLLRPRCRRAALGRISPRPLLPVARRTKGDVSGMIGLAFEPVRGRDKPDIAGTLWLDRKTAELRDLEYALPRLPGLPGT